MADIREMIAQSFPDATRTYRALTDNPGAAFDGLMANLLGGGEQVRNRLYDTARTAGQSVAQFQQNPLATAQQWGARLGGDVTQQVREALNNAQAGMSVMPQVSDQATRQAIPAMLGAVTPLQTVWHGTPYRFDPVPENQFGKFDISRVGAGQGAQSYGHGLYVAENPAVAKDYRTDLSIKNPVSRMVNNMYQNRLAAKLSPDEAMRQTMEWASKNPQIGPANAARAADEIKNAGSLYKVDLPDKHIERMLDWDKPLSQQPEIIKQLGITDQGMHQIKLIGGSDSVQGLLDYVAAHHAKVAGRGGITQADKAAASQTLADRGVPGIKYLDQGSRGGGKWKVTYKDGSSSVLNSKPDVEGLKQIGATVKEEGTRNYVVFRDDILKILSRE